MSSRGSGSARRSKAVAQEAAVAAEGAAPAPTAPAPAPEAVTKAVRRCCGEPVVHTTSGMDTEPVGFCAKHLPGNLRQ